MAKLESIMIEKVDNGLIVTVKEEPTRNNPNGKTTYIAEGQREVWAVVSHRLANAGFTRDLKSTQ